MAWGKVANIAGPPSDPLTDYEKLLSTRVAIANRENARVNIGILGASIVEGAFVSSYSRTVAQYLQTLLHSHFPTPGLTGGGRGYIGVPSGAMTTSTQYVDFWPLAFTGGAFDPVDPGSSTFDIGAKHMCWYANSTAKVVLTLDRPVTSFSICHTIGTSGGTSAGYYSIDGGAQVPFSTHDTTIQASVLHVDSPAESTIEVGHLNAGYLIFSGIIEYDGDEDKGIQVHNLGHSGFTIAEWQDGYSNAGSWREDVAALDLDLLILQDLGINDGFTLDASEV